jgi:uncharacterized repeat protein (TIGR01451 family)
VGVALVRWRITVDRPEAAAGERFTYTITATNVGTAPFPGATVMDDLTDVLAHAAFDGDAPAGAAFDPATGLLRWQGDVAAGAVVTVTYGVSAGDVPAETVVVNALRSADPGSNCPAMTDPDCAVSATILPSASLAVLGISLPATGWTPFLLGAGLVLLGAGAVLLRLRTAVAGD